MVMTRYHVSVKKYLLANILLYNTIYIKKLSNYMHAFIANTMWCRKMWIKIKCFLYLFKYLFEFYNPNCFLYCVL